MLSVSILKNSERLKCKCRVGFLFQAAGPEYEKARSPDLVRSLSDSDCKLDLVAIVATVLTRALIHSSA